MAETKKSREGRKEAESPPAGWIVEIGNMLECVVNCEVKTVKTGSICKVAEKIREGEAKERSYRYRPQHVAMGPFHRGTRSDLQIMEGTKWRFMHNLLFSRRTRTDGTNIVQSCSEAIRKRESIIRASYGEKIDMGSEEFSRIMLLDGCFLLELLLTLTENKNGTNSSVDCIDDKKKMLRILTDLTLLENQIPSVVLTKLAPLLPLSPDQLSPQKLAKSLFECDVASAEFSQGVYHFLHLIHLCSPDPYPPQKHGDPHQLRRCARELQAFGITIKASRYSQGNKKVGIARNKWAGLRDRMDYEQKKKKKVGIVASALMEFVDKFEFKIEFDEGKRELIIPTLHIREATEVKWRNLIALEQIGLDGISYKFTSYAYFFKDLVCSVHDIQLLKEKRVIRVQNDKEAGEEDLVKMFQSITEGAERRDARYKKTCKQLNRVKVKKGVVGRCVLVLRMPWHCWRRFWEWFRRGFRRWIRNFIEIYLGTPWKIVGVVVGTAVLALTITQTIYAVRAVK